MVEKVASRGCAAPARCQSLALRAAILGPGRALPLRVGRIAHYTHAQHTPAEHASQNIFCLSISLPHSHSSFPVSQLPFVSLDDVVT